MSQGINPYSVPSLVAPKTNIGYRRKLRAQFMTIIWLATGANFLLFLASSSLIKAVLIVTITTLLAIAAWQLDRLRTKRFLLTIYRPSRSMLVTLLTMLLFLPYAAVVYIEHWQDFHELVQIGSSQVLALHVLVVVMPAVLVTIVAAVVQPLWWCCTATIDKFYQGPNEVDSELEPDFEIDEESVW